MVKEHMVMIDMDETKYPKTLTSLTTSYYLTTEKPNVRKTFRFMTHKWTDIKNKISHLYDIREN